MIKKLSMITYTRKTMKEDRTMMAKKEKAKIVRINMIILKIMITIIVLEMITAMKIIMIRIIPKKVMTTMNTITPTKKRRKKILKM